MAGTAVEPCTTRLMIDPETNLSPDAKGRPRMALAGSPAGGSAHHDPRLPGPTCESSAEASVEPEPAHEPGTRTVTCEVHPPAEGQRPSTEEAAPLSAPGAAFQFSMRHLLAATAAAAAFMAVLARLGTISGIAAAWLAVLVAGHVLATAWGTAAKRRASRLAVAGPEPHRAAATQVQYAPPTRLRESTRLSRVVPIVCAAGALLGSVVGALLLVRANWDRLTFSSMLVGAASCAVIGGFVAFLASSFVTVASAAARQARAEQPIAAGACYEPPALPRRELGGYAVSPGPARRG